MRVPHDRAVSVGYAFKKDTKGERHGTPAERMLAEQMRMNMAAQARPNQLFAAGPKQRPESGQHVDGAPQHAVPAPTPPPMFGGPPRGMPNGTHMPSVPPPSAWPPPAMPPPPMAQPSGPPPALPPPPQPQNMGAPPGMPTMQGGPPPGMPYAGGPPPGMPPPWMQMGRPPPGFPQGAPPWMQAQPGAGPPGAIPQGTMPPPGAMPWMARPPPPMQQQ